MAKHDEYDNCELKSTGDYLKDIDCGIDNIQNVISSLRVLSSCLDRCGNTQLSDDITTYSIHLSN